MSFTSFLNRVSRLLAMDARKHASGRQPKASCHRPRIDFLEERCVPCTINWTGNGDGVSWQNSANWDLNQTPGAGDDVCIMTGTNAAVVHSQATDAIHSLTSDTPLVISGGSLSLAANSMLTNALRLTAGSLTGAGDLRIEAPLIWTGGTMDGTGTTTTVGGVSMSGSTVTLGRTLDNASIVTLDGPSSGLNISGTGTFNNAFGVLSAEFQIRDNGTISGAGRFVNNTLGTLHRVAGTGTATIQSRFDNIGIVQVDTGTLRIVTSGSSSQFNNTFGGAPGTTIEFVGGTQTFGPSSFISAPNVIFSGGTALFSGEYFASTSSTFSGATVTFTPDAHVDGVGRTLTVSAGSVNFNSPEPITVEDLSLTGGTLTGAADITVTRFFFWSGGTLSGSGTTDSNLAMAVIGSVTLGRTLNINLIAELDGPSASLTLSAGAVLNNQSNQPATGFVINDGGSIFGSGTFNNQPGSVVASDARNATIQAVFNNRGEVDIDSGTLTLGGGGNDPGSFHGMPGTTLQFSGGAHQLQMSSSIDVPNVVFSGGTVNLDGTYTASAGSTFSGAVVALNPAATLNDLGPIVSVSAGSVMFNAQPATLSLSTLNFFGGTIAGSESFNIVSGLWLGGTLGAGGAMMVTNSLGIGGGATLGRTLTIGDNGILSLLGPSSSLNLQNGVTLTVMYGLAIRSSQGISGSGTVTCNGIVQVMGNTTIQGTFNNAGSLMVSGGTLHLSGGGNESGSFTTDAVGGGLDFVSGTYDFQSSAIIAMPTVSFSGGTVNLNGTYDAVNSSSVSGATVTFNPGMSIMEVGTLSVSAGLVTFSSGQPINPMAFFFTGGRLTGSDDVTISGLFSWLGGTMDGTGTTTANAGMVIDGSGMTLGRTLTNNDIAFWTGTGDIFGTANAVFNNGVNGNFIIQNDQSFTSPSCLGTFNNHGYLFKTVSYGTTTIGLFVNDDGADDIETGIVNFACGIGGPGRSRPRALGSDVSVRPAAELARAIVERRGPEAMPATLGARGAGTLVAVLTDWAAGAVFPLEGFAATGPTVQRGPGTFHREGRRPGSVELNESTSENLDLLAAAFVFGK